MDKPLADLIRPKNLDEFFGQHHLVDEGRILRKIIETGSLSNLIFYGPSGTGKTTIASIIASSTDRKLYKLNATNACMADIKAIISELDGEKSAVLYLDEIQNFNKKQQQSLLEYIENGKLTLIASTTENPYFYIYNAILSRCNVLEFKKLHTADVEGAVKRAFDFLKRQYTHDAVVHIANISGGDVRKAINTVELCSMYKNGMIDLETAVECSQRKALVYDKNGDSHYDILSGFQKSIRGSDPDAGLHYLARLIAAGDLISPCRRLLVIASEDIGLAYPNAAAIVSALVDSAQKLGLPEARIPLAQAVIFLATLPKSNSVITAIDAALSDVLNVNCGEIPIHLKDAHYDGARKMGRGITYKYPHEYPNNYVKQQYLPDNIKHRVYYKYGSNMSEEKAKQYWEHIKKN